MVYCGRPSKGCAPCRAKRTKCDQAQPHCGQCRRAQRDCPGYRDEQDAVFRNETSKVVIKAQAATSRGSSRPVSSPIIKDNTSDGKYEKPGAEYFTACLQVAARKSTLLRVFPVPLEDQARYYFFYNFVSQDPSSLQTYSHVMPTVYRQSSPFNALPNIIEAIGLAGVSNVKQAPQLMAAAGVKYARALRAITASIQDSEEASKDQTLITVLLLGLFETVTCSSPESMRSWTNHLNGAIAIARLRGINQFHTKIGHGIFNVLVIQLVVDSLQRRLIIPSDIIKWAEIEHEDDTTETRIAHRLIVIIGRLCTLRANYRDKNNTDTRVVSLANLIDSDLEDWENSLPPTFSYSIVESANSECVFSNTYHVYKSTWTASLRNFYRCARILTQEVVTGWLSRNSMPDPSIDESQRRHSKVLLTNLAYDICASAPFILGASNLSVCSTRPPRAGAGAPLLWVLYLVATMDQELPGVRSWIITRLALIGRTMGIKQAESLANVLKTKREITAWDKFETASIGEVVDDW